MFRFTIITLALALAVACNDAPSPVQRPAEPYVIVGTVVDQPSNSITISIRVDPPVTQDHIKSVAEQAISRYRDQYRNVTVKSYAAGTSMNELPYATSILENGVVTHQITPGAATRKIPTH